MANKNKVEFGLSNVHFGTYDADQDGKVTLGEPVKVPGAVSLSLSAESESSDFYADDIVYFNSFTDNGETGDLTMALFPDEFKTQFLNYVELADGGIAKVKTKSNKNVYMAFEGKGDKEARRHILYNIALGAITREHKTMEGTKEVETEVLPITLTGDNATGIVKVSYSKNDAGYDKLFTTPPIPTLPDEVPEA